MAKSFRQSIEQDQSQKRIQNLTRDIEKADKEIQAFRVREDHMRQALAHANNENNTSEIEFKKIGLVRNLRDNYEYENIKELADNILKCGQLQSILLTSDNKLISGYRRYYAIKYLIENNQHNELIKIIHFDKSFKEIGLELFDIMQFSENEQRKSIDNFQRSNIFNDYIKRSYSQKKIAELFELDKATVSQIITIDSIDEVLKKLLKQIQYFGISKKKFDASNHVRDSATLGITPLYKIASKKSFPEQVEIFINLFGTKLLDTELLDLGYQESEKEQVSEIKVIQNFIENKLEKWIKNNPNADTENNQRIKNEILKLLKEL